MPTTLGKKKISFQTESPPKRQKMCVSFVDECFVSKINGVVLKFNRLFENRSTPHIKKLNKAYEHFKSIKQQIDVGIPVRIAFFAEMNFGKSHIINEIVGKKVVPEGTNKNRKVTDGVTTVPILIKRSTEHKEKVYVHLLDESSYIQRCKKTKLEVKEEDKKELAIETREITIDNFKNDHLGVKKYLIRYIELQICSPVLKDFELFDVSS